MPRLSRAGDRVIDARRLDRRVRIERPVPDPSLTGAGSGSWVTVADRVPASVMDMLPSRGERPAEGMTVATRPARVRMRFRSDVTSAMRLVDVTWGVDGRVMQIITVPAELGRREGLEFMVEDYSPAGNRA